MITYYVQVQAAMEALRQHPGQDQVGGPRLGWARLQYEPLGSSLRAMFTVWQHGLQNLLLTATICKIQVSPTKYALTY